MSNTDTFFTNARDPAIEEIRRYCVFLNLQYICERNRSAIHDGIPFAEFSGMGWICQHCGAPFGDSAYRVKSEESGTWTAYRGNQCSERLARQEPQELQQKAGFAAMTKATRIDASEELSVISNYHADFPL